MICKMCYKTKNPLFDGFLKGFKGFILKDFINGNLGHNTYYCGVVKNVCYSVYCLMLVFRESFVAGKSIISYQPVEENLVFFFGHYMPPI